MIEYEVTIKRRGPEGERGASLTAWTDDVDLISEAYSLGDTVGAVVREFGPHPGTHPAERGEFLMAFVSALESVLDVGRV